MNNMEDIIKIKVKTNTGEVFKIEFNSDNNITQLYDKLELIALFLGYHQDTIDREVNRGDL